MKKVKIAILGLNQGYKFAVDALKMPDVELIAVAGFGEQAEERARELGVQLFNDYKDLIHNCNVDGVIITLPNELHLDAVKLCAAKGIHVLVEKPIASTIEDGQEIIDQCKKYNVELLVGHHRRFSSKVRRLKEVIDSGVLGDIVGVNMLCMLAKNHDYFSELWRLEKGGGPLLINGIHEVDTLRYITGSEIKSVYAVTNNRIRGNKVEDTASVIFEMDQGIIVNYFISDGTPSPWAYDLNAWEIAKYTQFNGDCYQVFGTKGSVTFPSMKLYKYEQEELGWLSHIKEEHLYITDNDPSTEELAHFAAILRQEEKPYVTGEDALETLKVISAIKRSAAEKQNIIMEKQLVVK